MWMRQRSESPSIARPLLDRSYFPVWVRYLDISLAEALEDCVMQVAFHGEAFFHIGHHATQFEFKGLLAKVHEKCAGWG